MALSEADTEPVFQRLREENINICYVKTPLEFGMAEPYAGSVARRTDA
jgi:hypothetical protein